MSNPLNPFPTVSRLAAECGADWKSFGIAAETTWNAEHVLKRVLIEEAKSDRPLDADSSLVLCGSFARHPIANLSLEYVVF